MHIKLIEEHEDDRKNHMNIVLTGFMAAGKTTLGELLARELNYNFIDTDKYIEECSGRSIPEIFEKEGEEGFREYEWETAQDLRFTDGMVIAAGGGFDVKPFKNNENIKIVYIKRDLSDILPLLKGQDDAAPVRPNADGRTPEEIAELFRKREPGYEENADLILDLSKKQISPEDACKNLISLLK